MKMTGTRVNSAEIAPAVLRWFDENAAQGILVTDPTLTIRVWNQWLVDATGIAGDAAVGSNLFDVIPSLVERGLDQHFADALLGQVKILSHVFHRYVIPTTKAPAWLGAQMPQAARIAPLTDSSGVVGTITVIEDVSERVAAEELLRNRIATAEAASRVKDEFLATLSHEMRTPLNAVLGWTRILRARSDIEPAKLKRAIEVIDRNAAAQLTLVSDMLDIARISTGKVRLEAVDVDLGAIAIAAVDAIRPTADAKGVRLITDLAPQLPLVRGDADRLLQVAWNLLSNAVKFTDAGGEVRLRVSAEHSSVSMVVVDTGHGIEASFLPYVFQRFKQADPSSSRRHGGLGLGLALVKELVQLHGGTVTAASGGAGAGSTFTVRLPSRDAARPLAGRVETRESAAVGSLKGVRVLIIDDDADALELAVDAVTTAGGDVMPAASAAAGLALLESEDFECPHVIVTDVGMPGDDGFSFLRRLRSLSPGCGGTLPVIALTAYAAPEDRARTLSAGFVAHFAKPFFPEALVVAIARAAAM
jgi:PAS domain S-box-containing protein